MVLLIEDHDELREVVAGYLEESGFACHGVPSVLEARSALLNAGRFSAVVTDLIMPGEAPASFIEECRDQGIPVAVLTGLDQITARSMCPAGVPIMTKPVDLSEAIRILKELMLVQPRA